MAKFAALLVPVLFALCMYLFSALRTLRTMRKRSRRIEDMSLRQVSRRLAKAAGFREIHVYVYEINQVNGLVTPDGRIYITQGLLDLYTSGKITVEEVSSVLAHELGHVALGHTKRRLLDFAGQNAARVALSVLLSRFLPGIGPLVAGLLMTVIANRFSQADEYAADKYASVLLIKAGIGTEPQIRLLRKLELASGNAETGFAWMLSHPKAEARIAAIQKVSAQTGGAKAGIAEREPIGWSDME